MQNHVRSVSSTDSNSHIISEGLLETRSAENDRRSRSATRSNYIQISITGEGNHITSHDSSRTGLHQNGSFTDHVTRSADGTRNVRTIRIGRITYYVSILVDLSRLVELEA